jgi:hypothetical protein
MIRYYLSWTSASYSSGQIGVLDEEWNGADGRSRAHLDLFSNCPPLINVPLASATGEPGTRPARNETPRAVLKGPWYCASHRPLALALNSLGVRKTGRAGWSQVRVGVRKGPRLKCCRVLARRGEARSAKGGKKSKAY